MHIFKDLVIGALCIMVVSLACKKIVQVEPPDYAITTAMVYANDSTAREVVKGVYSEIMATGQTLLNGALSVYPGMSADDLQPVSSRPSDNEFYQNSLLSTNQIVKNGFWQPAYRFIYLANRNIEGISTAPGISVEVKKQLVAELQFIRATCYWHLVNLFGDVPFTTSSDISYNKSLARSPKKYVCNQVIDDLKAAWVSLTGDGAILESPSSLAAAALLARVYCYLQNWELAEIYATLVITNSKYQLEKDLNKVFLPGSRETIFQLKPITPNNSPSEAISFIPSSSTTAPIYTVSKNLLFSFANADLRKKAWIDSIIINKKTIYYVAKYKLYATQSQAKEYNVMLRLAEQYLIRAEARARQNNLPQALSDINEIRSRAGLPFLPTSVSLDSCLVAIYCERRAELFAEGGHRWFDLKRINYADSVLQIIKGKNWQSIDYLYPIPYDEMQNNPALHQNEGY